MTNRSNIPFKPIHEGTLGYAAKRWIIRWRSAITGLEGQSKTPMIKEVAENAASELNELYPEIKHWIERV